MVHAARDYIGIKPLFLYYESEFKYFEIASTVSALSDRSGAVTDILPAHTYTCDLNKPCMSMHRYSLLLYRPLHIETSSIFHALDIAIRRRVHQSERPVGFLLSGGLDSSIVLALALRSGLLTKPPEVFTFGFADDAPDVRSARVVVDWLRKEHGPTCINWHLVIDQVENGIKALPEVIQALETYDTTTIRASTPMYLLSRYIKQNTDVRVIISGEGSDELFGGYLYFKYAPNDASFRDEILRLLNFLSVYDVLRADRSTAAHGLEVRPPFLDYELVTTVLSNAGLRRGANTKQLLRSVIQEHAPGLLPDEILHGRKEAFSDAVGFSWKDTIAAQFGGTDGEAKYYQQTFYQYFGDKFHLCPGLWLPNQQWVKTGNEPSARALGVYSIEMSKKESSDSVVLDVTE